MTIQSIRRLQIACKTSFVLFLIISFKASILHLFDAGHLFIPFMLAALFFLAINLILLFIISQTKCPVCHRTYVGRRTRNFFTRACSNCGRRAGDNA